MDFFAKISKRNKNSVKDTDLINEENTIQNNYLFNYLDKAQSLQSIFCVYRRAYLDLISELKISKKNVIEGPFVEKAAATNEKFILHNRNNKINIISLYPTTRSPHKGVLKDQQYAKYLFGIEL